MDHHFFAYLYRLRYIERWSLMRNTVKENVAEHSYHTAILAHALCTIGNAVFDKQLDAERAATLALFHDATEMFTGDIPTPIKHHNPEILRNFRAIERSAADRLVEMIPEPLKSAYHPLVQQQEDGLRDYVKGADLLDAYLKCVSELAAGNREFSTAKNQIENAIKKLDLPEIDYFIQHLVPSFQKSLDELSQLPLD